MCWTQDVYDDVQIIYFAVFDYLYCLVGSTGKYYETTGIFYVLTGLKKGSRGKLVDPQS